MLANLTVTALISVFVAIAVLGHVLVITALLSKPHGSQRTREPAEPAGNQPAGPEASWRAANR